MYYSNRFDDDMSLHGSASTGLQKVGLYNNTPKIIILALHVPRLFPSPFLRAWSQGNVITVPR